MTDRNLYTIPANLPFLRSLGRSLLERAPEDLTQILVLLPTRRACRALRETLLDLNDGRPLLLPRLQPFGDVDQDELQFNLAAIPGFSESLAIPEAISPLRRLLLLSQLVEARDPALGREQALKLAGALAVLIDQVHTENLDFANLKALVPDGDLSRHWQLTLQFLSIVTDAWPAILAQEGVIDPADRRNRLMRALARYWEVRPPAYPVIAAGSTGSIPSTARLLDVISTMPRGAVILPGLDQDLDEVSWASFSETHPQATMRHLLAQLETDRRRVRLWPSAEAPLSTRPLLAREITRPAETVGSWTEAGHAPAQLAALRDTLGQLHVIETATLSDEAQAIAVILREALETPGRTAALVTPDRELARRVSSALKKWDLSVDDSAGCHLRSLPAGTFLETIFNCLAEQFSPLSLLSLLKHPFCRLMPEANDLSAFEISLCRGPRPAPGLAGLRLRAATARKNPERLLATADRLSVAFAPLLLLQAEAQTLEAWVKGLAATAEAVAEDQSLPWSGADGDAAGLLLADLNTQNFPEYKSSLQAFGETLCYLLQTVSVRPRFASHPRLVILGQLEARLIQSDVVVLGSLNEGSWPADVQHDPWMSRPMRAQFGLPSPERSIGLAAHDFAQNLSCSRVFLTRSLKIQGTPTVPSRWLQRLQTLLQAAALPLVKDTTHSGWAKALQTSPAPAIPAPCPLPTPPVASRPRELSATWVERWVKNPYHLYIRKILRLTPLEPLDADTQALERGSLVHKILERFLAETGPALPDAAQKIFMLIARQELNRIESDSADWLFWQPRLERLAEWFIAREREWRQEAAPWLLEASGSHTFSGPEGNFTLTAKADRIDTLGGGGAAIIDYKTGTEPSQQKMRSGEAAQLPLEGIILRHGGYGPKTEARILSHWKVSGGLIAGKARDIALSAPDDADNLITLAERGLLRLVAQYNQPDTPYNARQPGTARPYSEELSIHHLARTAEWSTVEQDEEAE